MYAFGRPHPPLVEVKKISYRFIFYLNGDLASLGRDKSRNIPRLIFKEEMRVYKAEGVPYENITFQDNQGCIDLIETRQGYTPAPDLSELGLARVGCPVELCCRLIW